MKPFMNDDFLLETETAKILFNDYAKDLPIIDYHCHIDPREIAENRHFDNIAQAWLGGDHYKWRLIRCNGVPEEEITGGAEDRVKFQRFAEALAKSPGNPMYHWTHLELQRYFNYYGALDGDTAEQVWTLCNDRLKSSDMSVRDIICRSNVEVIGTTDDPADTLEWHRAIKADKAFTVKVVPSWRPDRAVKLDKPDFAAYIKKLSAAAGMSVGSVTELKAALLSRMDCFEELGCRASDHGLDFVPFTLISDSEADAAFRAALEGKPLTDTQIQGYMTYILLFLAREYARRGWVMQLHCCVVRNTNTAQFNRLGADTGYDCISTASYGDRILKLLDTLEQTGELPKTVLYSLNPADNAQLDTIAGAFQSNVVPGKIQHGAAWWFNDTKSGMTEQLTSLANLSVLGNFIGMLTDSRSFLSYTRHEYFRRILCNFLGNLIENGEYPADIKKAGALVSDICYGNAKRYFGF